MHKSLNTSIENFNNTKATIVGSNLGKALGMSTTNNWATVVDKLKAVVDRGTLNWSGSNTTYSVPAGYYSGGTLDSRPSYNAGVNYRVIQQRSFTTSATTSYGFETGEDGVWRSFPVLKVPLASNELFVDAWVENTTGVERWLYGAGIAMCSDYSLVDKHIARLWTCPENGGSSSWHLPPQIFLPVSRTGVTYKVNLEYQNF